MKRVNLILFAWAILSSLSLQAPALAQPSGPGNQCGPPEGFFFAPEKIRAFRVGAECRLVDFEQSFLKAPSVDENAVIWNESLLGERETTSFVCPLENNYEDRALGDLSVDDCHDTVAIYVVDQDPDLDVWCRVRAIDPFLYMSESSGDQSSCLTPPCPAAAMAVKIEWFSFTPSPDTVHWYVHCDVPNRGTDPRTGALLEPSGITAYYMDELEIVDLIDP